MKRGPPLRSLNSYDTEEEEGSSSDDDLLPPDPSSVTIPSAHPQHFPDPDDMSSSINAPNDRLNVIYIIFLIQGIGMLLPWNFFITAKEYFEYKFKGDKSVQHKFENAFALAAMFPNVISLFLNIFLTNKLSRGLRVTTCLGIMFTLFAVTSAFVKIDTESWPDKFFIITICCVVIINISSGIYQGTIFGVAGIVGQRYIQAIMSGQATAGVFAALADLVSKLAADNKTPTTSAFIYFLIATFVIAVTAISYTFLFKLPRMQFYFRRFQRHADKDYKQNRINEQEHDKPPPPPYWQIFKKLLPAALSVTIVFSVTLSMFPAVISSIQSVNKDTGSRWNKDLFPTVVCFLVFNAGDWVGRVLAGQIQIASEKGPLLPILCIARVVFIPLFLMCNVGNIPHLPYVFKHDAWPVVINVLFSVTNGYLGSLCMMFGPKLVPIEYAETAGTIMSLFLCVGLSLGACISFAFS